MSSPIKIYDTSISGSQRSTFNNKHIHFNQHLTHLTLKGTFQNFRKYLIVIKTILHLKITLYVLTNLKVHFYLLFLVDSAI